LWAGFGGTDAGPNDVARNPGEETPVNTFSHRRPGLSLVELLVVISIIAILIAFSMAGVMSVRRAQQVRSSEDVVQKVQLAVDRQYKAIVDQARKDVQLETTQDAVAIKNFMLGDPDAALALLTYCRIRQSFPQTFAEVAPFSVYDTKNSLVFTFHVKSQFTPLQGAIAPSTYPADAQQLAEQSAMLLYAAVAQTGAGGAGFAEEALNSAVKPFELGGVTAPAYIDAWQRPVGFCRFGTNWELQNPKLNATNPNNQKSIATNVYVNPKDMYQDPLDPRGSLYNWALTANAGVLNKLDHVLFVINKDPANATGFIPPNLATGEAQASTNRRPIVYSMGYNGAYESLNDAAATTPYPALDDILGYRLTQLGKKGTQ
jgi:prepilin-type N-terminal cleavage/methylation domain-containing protein